MAHTVTFTAYAGVLIEYEGAVTGEDLLEGFRRIVHDPRFKSLRYYLSDATGRAAYDVDPSQVRALKSLTEAAAELNPNLVMALVRPASVQFGMTRMYQMVAVPEGFQVCVFRTLEEAREWIRSTLPEPD